ncbi:unnamed protein product, partial [Vitis vinifera]
MGDGEYQYSVGDFVWGKIKSHPWWPGQIYDPKDASKHATKYSQRDRLLVAYFGDGTFAWCYPSQLKPFEENFIEMSKQSNSRSFLKAVEEALAEIGRHVELEMTCSCTPKEIRIGLSRPLTVNAGVKEGAVMPEGGIRKFSVAHFEPAEFLSGLKCIGQVVSVTSMLEFSVLKSQMSAFFRSKGPHHQLAVYHEPQEIAGLEEKQKSMAEIMRGNGDVEPKNEETDMGKEDINSVKLATASEKKRRKKGGNEAESHVDRALSVESDGSEGKRESENSPVSRERKKKGLSVENDGGRLPEESEQTSVSRERKKSKYLCPPYTNVIRMHRNSGSMGDSKTEFLEVSNTPKQNRNKVIDLKEIRISLQEVLSGIRSAALNPFYLRENKSVDKISGFLSAFRTRRSRKNETAEPDGPELKQAAAGKSDTKTKHKDKDKKVESATLLLSFGPGISLPSKDDLIKIFSKFGTLNESETEILYDSFCARVVFSRSSDAEEAFNGSQKASPFGAEQMKSNLEGEMKGLLEKVSTMAETSSS